MNLLLNYHFTKAVTDTLASGRSKSTYTLVLHTPDLILLHLQDGSVQSAHAFGQLEEGKKKVLKIEMSVQAAYDDEDDERSCRTRQTER